MAGIDLAFNIALGKLKYYYELPAANDAIIVVPLESTGIEADATLRDYDDLSALLAGSSNEQTTMGRKTLTSFTITVDDTNNWATITLGSSFSWTAATGNQVGKILFCYDPDTTAGTDTTIVPLLAYNVTITPSGTDVTVNAHANGLIRIT